MQIGRARPLAAFCWLLCLVAIVYVCWAPGLTVLSIGTGIFLFLSFALLTAALVLRPFKYRLLYLFFLSLALLTGTFCAMLHEYRVVSPAENFAKEYADQTVPVTGIVVSEEYYSNYLTCVGASIDLPSKGILQKGTAKIYLNLSGQGDAHVGDRFYANVTLYPVADAPEEDYVRRRLVSEGYTLIGYVQDPADYETSERGNFVLTQWLSRLQYRLSDQLSFAVKGEEGKLVSALLLGTKSELSGATKLDFRRAGASHLLALSGLHLSLIVLVLSALLSFLRCPFYLRMFLLSLVALIFLALTGFSMSLLRATIMLLLLYLSRLRGCPHDPLTSLSLFLGVTLTVDPVAVFDAGLWLSVTATFVLIEVIPALLRRDKKESKREPIPVVTSIVRYVLLPVFTSCIILFFLLLPMALIFGETSLLSPVSNLVLTPLTGVILALGLCYLPLSYLGAIVPFFAFLSDHIARILHTVAGWMLSLSQKLSDMRGVVIPLRGRLTTILLVLLAVVLILFLLLRWKRPKRFFYIMGGWTAVFVLCLCMTRWQMGGTWQASYVSNKINELLCLSGNEGTVVCDVTDGSYTTYRELLSDHLPDHATEIEALVLTHYHNRHISTVYKLLGDIRVRTIWLPLTMPDTKDQDKALKDEGILRTIATLAKKRRVEVRYYLLDEGAHPTPSLRLKELHFSMLKRSTHPTVSMTWQYAKNEEEDGTLVWLGASSWESDLSAEIFASISSADVLIFAAHGPVIKSSYSLADWSNIPELVLFANGNVSAAIEPSPDMTVILKRARLILGDEDAEMTLP